jgi:predicted transcriptional regulator
LEKVNDSKNDDATKRRSRLDIIAEILDVATDGTVKTKIMCRTNVNFIQFNEYAKCLLEARLIGIIRREGKTIYKTTEKGKLLLRRFNETEEMFNAPNSEECDRPSIVKKEPMVYLVKK